MGPLKNSDVEFRHCGQFPTRLMQVIHLRRTLGPSLLQPAHRREQCAATSIDLTGREGWALRSQRFSHQGRERSFFPAGGCVSKIAQDVDPSLPCWAGLGWAGERRGDGMGEAKGVIEHLPHRPAPSQSRIEPPREAVRDDLRLDTGSLHSEPCHDGAQSSRGSNRPAHAPVIGQRSSA